MDAKAALKLLNEGKADELKSILEKEIYSKSLTTSERKRFQAMQRFFKFSPPHVADMCKYPCVLVMDDEEWTTFLNGHALIFTRESCKTMKTIEKERYFTNETKKMIKDFDEATGKKIDVNEAIAELLKCGYARKKREVAPNCGIVPYCFTYDNARYNAGLFEIAYSIIANDETPVVYHKKGEERQPVFIQNSIGTAMILPFAGYGRIDTEIKLEDFLNEK